MKMLKLIQKEIKCDENGKGWVTIAGLARLAGVDYNAAKYYAASLTSEENKETAYKNNDLQVNKREVLISDIEAGKYVASQAANGNRKALATMSQFFAVGLRTMIQMESGYHNKQAETLRITTDELFELREKRKFESINENTAKAILKERNNNKVHDLPLVAIELGLIEIVDIEKKYKAQIPTAMGTELGLTMNRNVIYYPKSLHPVLKSEVAVKRWIAQRMEDQESIFDD